MWENDQREKTPVCNLDGRILASSFSLFFKKKTCVYILSSTRSRTFSEFPTVPLSIHRTTTQ